MDGSLLKEVEYDQWVRFLNNTEVWYSSSDKITSVLNKELKKDEVLFIVGIYSWDYNLKPLIFCKGVKKIISVRGMLHPGALSQKSFKKRIYLQLWKWLGLHKGNIFHATDAEEKKYIQQVFGEKAIVKIAANIPRLFALLPMPAKIDCKLIIGSIALISAMKNHLKVLEALHTIKSNYQIVYNIYGPVKDPVYWEQCQKLMASLPKNIQVNYKGAIAPTEVEKALAENQVIILPSKSENFGHSIIEALSAGRPVITSNTTPWNGLAAAEAGINVPGEDILGLANAISDFAAMDSTALSQWSRSAREYALKGVDLDRVKGEYRELFNV
ncbi:MAG: glycosyltransferase [Sphingobacteriales bacterium]|nr:glycosyltransferase [Sphingobacteriales bacterium]